MKTLSLIVPCFNEQESIPLFYTETIKVVSSIANKYKTTFVFVDDGSSDNTLKILKGLAEKDSSVKYISFSRNFGKESAMLAGMDYAQNSDFIGILDADLQHSPELIPEMLIAVDKEGYDVCAARRADRDGEAKFKSILSQSFYKVINKISETKISDSAQDFRVMKQSVVKAILSVKESIRFSKGIFSWVGFNVKWISHKNRERVAGETKWSIGKLLKYAFDGILGYTSAPLKISFVFSFLFFVISFSELVYGIVKNIIVPNYTLFLPLILCVAFFVGAVVLLCLGILGEYIARIYTETKDRPRYIISQTNIE